MRRLVAALLFLAGFVPLAGGTAWACSCHWGPEPERYRGVAESGAAVYTGEVIGPYTGSGYVVRVERDLEGGMSGTRHVKAAQDSAACGITLEPGRVFLVEYDGWARSCSLTSQSDVDAAAATYELYNAVGNAVLPSVPEAAGNPPPLAAVLAGIGLAAGAVVLVRRRTV